MTQDEVDLIYDYLHEHYSYMHGELIRKNGEKLGNISYRENCCIFRTSLWVDGKAKHFIMKKLLYIYYHKKYPDFVISIDGNEFNLDKNNLLESSIGLRKKSSFSKGKYGSKEVYKIYYYTQNKKLVHMGATENIDDAKHIAEILDELFLIRKMGLQEIIIYLRENFPLLILKEKANKLGKKGVHFNGKLKSKAKYTSKISFNKKSYSLGYFMSENNAHKAYLYVAEKIKNNKKEDIKKYIEEARIKYKAKDRDIGSSNMRGVYVRENGLIWARYSKKYLGSFETVEEAHEAYLDYKRMIEAT
jgi:hypothetical protein